MQCLDRYVVLWILCTDIPESGFTGFWTLSISWSGQYSFTNSEYLYTRAGSVDFSFQYPASVKPYRFQDTERRNCVLAYSQLNRPTHWK